MKQQVYYNMKEFDIRLKKIQDALEKAISLDICEEWKNDSFGKISSSVKNEYILNLISPNKNLIDLGGKRWRPLLMILCYEIAKNDSESKNNDKNNLTLSEDQIYSLTPLVEFVHTASLIHDDIEDSADLRRGKPAAHITYGLDTALNAASWLYFQAPVCIDKLDITAEQKLVFYELYSNELRKLHLGQAMDIYWHREKSFFPQIDEYKSMVKCKTGTLASLAAQIGFLAGGYSKEKAAYWGEIAVNIGIGFQIIDDVLNLTKGNPGKKRGDDIVEGKKSLPILLHIQSNPQDKEKISELMNLSYERGIDSPYVEECISLLQKSNCIEKAKLEGIELITKNCNKFSSSPLILELFSSMIPQDIK